MLVTPASANVIVHALNYTIRMLTSYINFVKSRGLRILIKLK